MKLYGKLIDMYALYFITGHKLAKYELSNSGDASHDSNQSYSFSSLVAMVAT